MAQVRDAPSSLRTDLRWFTVFISVKWKRDDKRLKILPKQPLHYEAFTKVVSKSRDGNMRQTSGVRSWCQKSFSRAQS